MIFAVDIFVKIHYIYNIYIYIYCFFMFLSHARCIFCDLFNLLCPVALLIPWQPDSLQGDAWPLASPARSQIRSHSVSFSRCWPQKYKIELAKQNFASSTQGTSCGEPLFLKLTKEGTSCRECLISSFLLKQNT